MHDVGRSTRAKRGLAAATTKGTRQIRTFALLQEHDHDQEKAHQNVQNYE
jgi:hypothetical protein